jgi:hypothetical protein
MNSSGCLRGRQVFGGSLAAAIVTNRFERKLLAFVESAHARAFDSRDVNEHIRAAAILLNEAKTFGGVEELYGTSCHDDFLSIDIENPRPTECRSLEKSKLRRKIAGAP